jgi:hypothetical protein
MKKLILIVFLLTGIMAGAHAQNAKKAPAKLPKALVGRLGLTADQQTQISAILQTKATKLDSLTAAQTDKKILHKEKKAVNDEAILKVESLLTADQKKMYADFRAEQQAKKAKKTSAAPASTTPPAQ